MKTMFVCKTFAAMDTDMWPFSGVYSCVCRKMMLQEKRLPAFRTGIRSFFWYTDLTSHILLLFDLCFDLGRINVRQHVSEMSCTVRLTGSHVIRVCLI